MAVISIKNKTKSGSLLVGNAFYDPGNFKSIATTTVGSTAVSSVTFSSIPSTYTHLQIRALYFGTSNPMAMQANIGIGAKSHILEGYGTSIYTYAYDSAASKGMYITDSGNGMSTSIGTVAIVDILDYANTNKNKTWRAISGVDTNSIGAVQLSSGFWNTTSAITSLTFNLSSTGTISQYSSFALYGIKGA
jgi:hypothetical protein